MDGINEVIKRIEKGLNDRSLPKLSVRHGEWRVTEELMLKHRNGKLEALWGSTIMKSLPLPAPVSDSQSFAMDFVELVPTAL